MLLIITLGQQAQTGTVLDKVECLVTLLIKAVVSAWAWSENDMEQNQRQHTVREK